MTEEETHKAEEMVSMLTPRQQQGMAVERITKIERLKLRTRFFLAQLCVLVLLWLLVSFVVDTTWGPLQQRGNTTLVGVDFKVARPP